MNYIFEEWLVAFVHSLSGDAVKLKDSSLLLIDEFHFDWQKPLDKGSIITFQEKQAVIDKFDKIHYFFNYSKIFYYFIPGRGIFCLAIFCNFVDYVGKKNG